jgi:hypothetical protein
VVRDRFVYSNKSKGQTGIAPPAFAARERTQPAGIAPKLDRN